MFRGKPIPTRLLTAYHVARGNPDAIIKFNFLSLSGWRMSKELDRKVKTALNETRLLILGVQVLLGFEFQCFFQDDAGVPGSWIELADCWIAAGRRSGSLFRNAGGATRISSSSRARGGPLPAATNNSG